LLGRLNTLSPTAQGNLEKTPLIHLLVYSLDQKLKGSTVFWAPDETLHVIYFHNGVPSKVRTAAMVCPLDRALVEMGLLDENTLAGSLRVISQRGILHGEYLVSQGHLDKAKLLAALTWQLVRKVAFMFKLPATTRYAFYDGVNLLDDYGGPELTPSEPLALIMSGVRGGAHNPLIDHTLARLSKLKLTLHPDADVSRLTLMDHEKRVVELLRAKPLPELLGTGVAQERVVKLVVYALVITRCINLGAKSRPPVGVDAPRRRRSSFTAHAVAVAARSETSPSSLRQSAARAFRPTPSRGVSAPPPMPGTAAAGASPQRRQQTSSGGRSLPPPLRKSAPRQNVPPLRSGTSSAGPGRTTGTGTRPPTSPRMPAMSRTPTGAGGSPPAGRVSKRPPLRSKRSTTGSVRPSAPQRGTAISRAEIEERHELIDDQNFFEILDITRDATPDAIESTYFKAAKLWHPDRLPADLADLKPAISKIFARISEAYKTLSDDQKRSEYTRLVAEGGGTAREQEMVARVVDSAMLFQKAEVMFKKGNVATAESLIKQAVEADPDQPEYRALYAWIQAARVGTPAQLADGERTNHYRKQIQMLDEVIKSEPAFERALFYRAELLKRSGFTEKAMRDYRKAAKINPRNIDAARMVRLHERRQKRRTSTGILGRLFGKTPESED